MGGAAVVKPGWFPNQGIHSRVSDHKLAITPHSDMAPLPDNLPADRSFAPRTHAERRFCPACHVHWRQAAVADNSCPCPTLHRLPTYSGRLALSGFGFRLGNWAESPPLTSLPRPSQRRPSIGGKSYTAISVARQRNMPRRSNCAPQPSCENSISHCDQPPPPADTMMIRAAWTPSQRVAASYLETMAIHGSSDDI